MHPGALGKPYGSFPSFRCNNGKPFNIKKPCSELTSQEWLVSKLGRQYTRMVSRQIFAYGVIFNLTGDPEALQHAQAGVHYLQKNLFKDQVPVTYLGKDGKPGFTVKQRTSQDLAYAQLGLTFYYYLTRDPIALEQVVNLKNYIFEHYRDKKTNMLKWVLEDSDEQSATQQELVAQLDQINAYMLLMYPLLPAKEKAQWREDLLWLKKVLINQFHDDKESRFYGYIHDESGKSPTARHGDFGHTAKAYWMLYMVGLEINEPELVSWAEPRLLSVLDRAYGEYELMQVATTEDSLPEDIQMSDRVGFWNSHEGKKGSAWWEYAELDQAAWILSLKYPQLDDKIRLTYPTWFNSFIDFRHGGTWIFLNGLGTAKAFHWKNGYHETERALILYLMAKQKKNEKAYLYYALPKSAVKSARPYFFRGSIEKVHGINSVNLHSLSKKETMHIQRIGFSRIH